MRTAQIKQQLHDYIDSAEDKKLKALYTLLEDDIFDKELDKRYDDYMSCVGKTFTWEETVTMAEQALAEREEIAY